MSQNIGSSRSPFINEVRFNVIAHAAWAPNLETPAAWLTWANSENGMNTDGSAEPSLPAMPAMLRRRASPAGKMALHAAYGASAGHLNIPTIFCSRHGECGRSSELLMDLAQQLPLSPTAFSLSVHNATGGLFSIARRDHANSLALSAGHSTIEHGAIEACGLLADGATMVLLVAADGPMPLMYREFADCDEQSFGWAWLLQAAQAPHAEASAISLRWSHDATQTTDDSSDRGNDNHDHRQMAEPGGLQIMRFFLRGDACLQRRADNRQWTWSRND